MGVEDTTSFNQPDALPSASGGIIGHWPKGGIRRLIE